MSEQYIRGNPHALIQLVEYGDFESPLCKQAFKSLEVAFERMSEDLRVQFRHFPIRRFHPHAQQAAEAAEAAGAQGKFWQMHDLLCKNSPKLAREELVGYAAELGLDFERFIGDLDDRVHAKTIDRDFQSGIRHGVNNAPTLFINGKFYEGDWKDGEALLSHLQHAKEEEIIRRAI